MGAMSMWHWLIVLGLAVLLFGGGGKISSIMGDVAKGVKSFKKGMADDDDATEGGKAIGHDAASSKSAETRAEKA
jgi:sec-independent protein translocase protein TatA